MNEDLRQAIPFEEFDYQSLMGALAYYARSRDKVTDLLARGGHRPGQEGAVDSRRKIEDGRAFLIAAPEKALADKLREGRGLGLRTQKECLGYLVEDLRIEEAALRELDAGLLDELA